MGLVSFGWGTVCLELRWYVEVAVLGLSRLEGAPGCVCIVFYWGEGLVKVDSWGLNREMECA
jgi:hypothetical protein